jgi:signal transduction histidine kinase
VLCITHISLIIFYPGTTFLVWTITENAGPFLHFNQPVLTTLVAFHTIILLVSTVIPSRTAYRKAVEVIQTELQIKAKFMRYITHELRNPTSIVSAALDLVKTKLESCIEDEVESCKGNEFPILNKEGISTLEVYRSLADVVSDAQGANGIALKVLNEFLIFDKLKSKMLDIEATFQNRALSTIKSMVQPFYAAARQKGITLSVRTTGDQEETSQMERLFLVADVGKIGQVMRNFLSNAIKFTQPPGNVEVRFSWCRNERMIRTSSPAMSKRSSNGQFATPFDVAPSITALAPLSSALGGLFSTSQHDGTTTSPGRLSIIETASPVPAGASEKIVKLTKRAAKGLAVSELFGKGSPLNEENIQTAVAGVAGCIRVEVTDSGSGVSKV